MIVYKGGDKVICNGNCVDVASKMKVYVLHRNYLRIAAAARSALYAEARSERRLAECNH